MRNMNKFARYSLILGVSLGLTAASHARPVTMISIIPIRLRPKQLPKSIRPLQSADSRCSVAPS